MKTTTSERNQVRGASVEAAAASGDEALRASEVESDATAIEVRVLWGGRLVHVAHLAPDAGFSVGAADREGRVDLALPEEKLGAARLVLVERGARHAKVRIPRGALGFVEASSGARRVLDGSEGECDLDLGMRVRLELADLALELSAVRAGKRVVAPFSLAEVLAGSAFGYVAGAGAAIGGLLVATALVSPSLAATSSDEMSVERHHLIQHYLASVAESEPEERPAGVVVETPSAAAPNGGTGTRAKHDEGTMGALHSREHGKRYAVAGEADNPDPHLARQAALRDAADFGMVGLIASGLGGDPDAPTAPWGRDDSLGSDPVSARGVLWGDAVGESYGVGGLGLMGIGEGGGGRGEGLGLGGIGTIGHGAGLGKGQGIGFAGGVGIGRAHRATAPQVRMGATTFQGGRLPPETIQAIVRQNFGRFRACYEVGLRTNPSLQGTVSVQFVIGRDGTVVTASGGGTLPDSGVTSCVAGSFRSLHFPTPDGGVVRVTYPIAFTNG